MLESEGWKVVPPARRGSARPSARVLAPVPPGAVGPASCPRWRGPCLRAVASCSLLVSGGAGAVRGARPKGTDRRLRAPDMLQCG